MVIPVHDNLEVTRGCLASLARQQVDFPFEVVVADDGSDPSTAGWLRRESGARVVRLAECRGYPVAVNAGLEAARGELLLVLNNDTLLPSGTLQRLVGALRDHPRVGLVGPSCDRIKGAQRIDVPSLEGDPVRVEDFGSYLAYQYEGKVEDLHYVMGVAMLFSRATLERTGGLDERFGPGNFEDDDFCFRVKEQGLRVLAARDAFVHHLGGRTFASRGMDYRRLLQENQRRYLDKWRDHPVMGAYVHQQGGDLERALFNCRAALAGGTKNQDALRILGEVLYRQGHPREALHAFDRLLELAPRCTSAAILKTSIHLDLDQEREARRALGELLLDFYVDDRSAAYMLAIFAQSCLAWGKEEEARSHLALALELHPECEAAKQAWESTHARR